MEDGSEAGTDRVREADLAPTPFLEADDPTVLAFAQEVTAGADDDVGRARALFSAVRDRIRYDPYAVSAEPEDYRASRLLDTPRSWCVPKAVLLTAAARAVGIPARLGFADVRNHLTSEKLRARLGTDLFVFHGYVALHVSEAWHKVTPAFNAELCERFGVPALTFDGSSDALLQLYDASGREQMEYVRDRGTYDDLPLEEILETFAEVYGGSVPAEDEHDEAFHG